MISYLLFTIIPSVFKKIYQAICDSFLYRILGKFWHWLKDICQVSFTGRALGESKKSKNYFALGGFAYLIDSFVALFYKLIKRLISILTFGTYSCIITKIWNKLKILYSFLDYEFICGVSILVVFLCPGEMWHNTYGLGISLVLLFGLICLTATGKKKIFPISILGLGFVIFVVTAIAGVFVASDHADALRVFVFFATSFLFTIIITGDIESVATLKKVLGFVYVAVVITGMYAIVQRIQGVEVSASLTDLTTNAGMPGRVYSTFENPNNYAEFLILTMPMCVAYVSMVKSKWLKLASALFMAFPLVALLMTYSRSCWVSFAITAFIFVFLYNKKLLPIIIVLAVLCIPFLPATVLARIGTIGSTQDSSNMYRIYIWEGVLRMLKTNWATGVGLGPNSFRSVYLPVCNLRATPAPHSHMLFMEIWVEQGIIGILAYLGMIFSVLRRGLISLKYCTKETKITLIAGISSICGIMFACSAEYIWFYPRVMVTYFIILGIMYACIKLASENKEQKASL